MRSRKDFIYDINDVLLAIAILLVAGILIFWRLNVIMDYPKTLAAETGTENTTEKSVVDNTDKTVTSDDSGSSSNSIWSNGVLSKDVTVTISGGSAMAAVENLVEAGLFESYDEYSQVCKAAGHNPESVRAGTFTFDAGCTQTDIATQTTL